MALSKAVTLTIGDLEQPVVTLYQLGVIVHFLYKIKPYKGQNPNQLRKETASSGDLNSIVRRLLEDGVLHPVQGLAKNAVFGVLGKQDDNVEDIVCTIDPFSYASHLSAMEYHGLTDRMPSKLFLSSPPAEQWKQFAGERMKKDLDEDDELYFNQGMPTLRRTRLDKIKRREIHRFASVHWGAYRTIHGRKMRVSTLGRTFLDMLRNPDLCGGIHHVLSIYESHAKEYLQLIVDEVDQHGSGIDKVRAGYIPDEKLKLKHGSMSGWLDSVQRGGSRKLDAKGEYVPKWSEKWYLSLNVI